VLTETLKCEHPARGYPKAALFAFCVALVAYNVLAVIKAALRVVHGTEKVENEVSLPRVLHLPCDMLLRNPWENDGP
jgi:hypothetical protein